MAGTLLESPASVFAGEDAALEAIDLILSRGAQVLYDHYIRDRTNPFATSHSLDLSFEVAHTRFLDADPGEPGHATSSAWTVEEEPAPSKCDAWARSTVPLKKKRPKAPAPLDAAAGRPASSASSRRAGTPMGRSQKSRGGDTERLQSEEPVIMMRTSTPEAGAGDREGGSDDQIDSVTEEELAYMAKIAEMERQEAEEEARKESAKAAEKSETLRMERIASDYRGKSIIFDHHGNVVTQRPPRPEKLPPQNPNTGVNITDAVEEPQEDASPKRRRRAAGGGRRKGKGKRKGKGGVAAGAGGEAVEGGDAYFTVSGSSQPPLLSSIKLSVGVDAGVDGDTRRGPARHADPTHMSRQDFAAHQSSLESKGNKVSKLGGGGGGGGGGSGAVAAPAAGAGQQSPASPPSKGAAGAGAGAGAPAMPSIDATTGGRSKRQPKLDIVTDQEDANLQLVNSPDWGQNVSLNPDFEPGQSPSTPKPTPKQNELLSKMMGGEAVRNPRDRPYIIRDPSPSKHMPAPPLGQSTGHGLASVSPTASGRRGKASGSGAQPSPSTVRVEAGERFAELRSTQA